MRLNARRPAQNSTRELKRARTLGRTGNVGGRYFFSRAADPRTRRAGARGGARARCPGSRMQRNAIVGRRCKTTKKNFQRAYETVTGPGTKFTCAPGLGTRFLLPLPPPPPLPLPSLFHRGRATLDLSLHRANQRLRLARENGEEEEEEGKSSV